jgi:hypothetical protein
MVLSKRNKFNGNMHLGNLQKLPKSPKVPKVTSEKLLPANLCRSTQISLACEFECGSAT